MQSVYLYGASGHAKVVAEIIESEGKKVSGLFDDDPAINQLLNYSVERYPGAFDLSAHNLIISIGSNSTRKRIAGSIKGKYSTAIHPSANISQRASIQEGTVVMAGVSINSDTSIGRHCIINTNSSIDHDCIVEDFVHISPNVALCGAVIIGEGSHVGAGAVIIPGIKIGKWCTIGAGAVVIRDIPEYTIAYGNPCQLKPKV